MSLLRTLLEKNIVVYGFSYQPGAREHRQYLYCLCVLRSFSCVRMPPNRLHPARSLVHGASQTRIPEWVAISSSRGSSQPRDQTCFSRGSCTGRGIFHYRVTWEAHIYTSNCLIFPVLQKILLAVL